jgi:hypothetical protein
MLEITPSSQTTLLDRLKTLASTTEEKLNYESSIVDLLKLLDLDSSLDSQKRLAAELDIQVGLPGQHKHNAMLHKAMMEQLRKCGGEVPDRILRLCSKHETARTVSG